MIKPKIYHCDLIPNSPYTFDLGINTTNFLIKNFTDGTLKISFGDFIDNNSYSILPKDSAERLFVSSVDNKQNSVDKITVVSNGEGTIEIRLLDF